MSYFTQRNPSFLQALGMALQPAFERSFEQSEQESEQSKGNIQLADLLGISMTDEEKQKFKRARPEAQRAFLTQAQSRADQEKINRILGGQNGDRTQPQIQPNIQSQTLESEEKILQPTTEVGALETAVEQPQINQRAQDFSSMLKKAVQGTAPEEASQLGFTFLGGNPLPKKYDAVINSALAAPREIENKLEENQNKINALIALGESPAQKQAIKTIENENKALLRDQERYTRPTRETEKRLNEIDDKGNAAREGLKLVREMAPLLQKASAASPEGFFGNISRLARNKMIKAGLTSPEIEKLQSLSMESVIKAVSPLPRIKTEFEAILNSQPNIFNTAEGNALIMNKLEQGFLLNIEKQHLATQLERAGADPKLIPQSITQIIGDREEQLLFDLKEIQKGRMKSLSEEKSFQSPLENEMRRRGLK